jgi:hypothetical protein
MHGAIASCGREERATLVDRIYPYLVTAAFPESKIGLEPQLGHGIRATVVVEVNGLIHSLTQEELQALAMPWDSVRALAVNNLDRLVREKRIGIRLFDSGPGGRPFILVGGNWASAALILSPKFRAMAEAALHTSELCASIPHREALLVFPKGNRASRDAMRQMIRTKEADALRPLTWELFELTPNGAIPFTE